MNYKIFLQEKNDKVIELTDRNVNDYDQEIRDNYKVIKNHPVPTGSKIEAYLPSGRLLVKSLVF